MTTELTKTEEKARKARQKAFLETLDELEKVHRQAVDLVRRAKEIATTGQTGTEPLWRDFVRMWEEKTGDTYDGPIPAGKGVIRRLLKTLSAEDIRFRMVRYFEGGDDFRRRNGYSVTLFGQQIHSLGHANSAAPKSDEQLARELSRKAGLFGNE